VTSGEWYLAIVHVEKLDSLRPFHSDVANVGA